jgi:hypothetical protein
VILLTLNNTVYKLNITIFNTFSDKDQTYLAVNSANINKANLKITKLLLKVLQNICLSGLSLLKL